MKGDRVWLAKQQNNTKVESARRNEGRRSSVNKWAKKKRWVRMGEKETKKPAQKSTLFGALCILFSRIMGWISRFPFVL